MTVQSRPNFADLNGVASEGWTDLDAEAITVDLENVYGVRFICVWDFHDDYGFGGDSSLAYRDNVVGRWREVPPALHELLFGHYENDEEVPVDELVIDHANDPAHHVDHLGFDVKDGPNVALTRR